MNALLITYDLNRETYRPHIVDAIKDLGLSYTKLSESSYAIVTLEMTPEDVYTCLDDLIDDDDRIYIITISKPWEGYGSEKTDRWLNESLPE